MDRRSFLGCAGLALAVAPRRRATRQRGAGPVPLPPSPEPYANLRGGGPHHLTPEQEAQRFTDSPAPAGPPGRWEARAALPLPRSEMAWATARAGPDAHRRRLRRRPGQSRLSPHLRPARPIAGSTARRCRAARTTSRSPPTAAGSTPSAASSSRTGAPTRNAYVYEIASDRWIAIAPLPRPRGAAAAVVLEGRVHLIGGASEPAAERASVGWHEVYDPKEDRWSARKALPGARDHVGCIADAGRIHVIGGRFNTFEYNTALHHVYLPAADTWELRAPLPTERSGHGLVVYRGRYWAMGGEGGILAGGVPRQAKVFGQMESYDPATDTWQQHAPMPTPRHAVGAAAIGDWIYVAGGGAVLGGAVQSAVHEAFTLGPA